MRAIKLVLFIWAFSLVAQLPACQSTSTSPSPPPATAKPNAPTGVHVSIT